MVSSDFRDQDVIGFHREGIALEIVVMSIRGGKLGGSRAFSFTGQEFPDAELLSSFIGLYYDLGAPPPDEVLLPLEIEDAALKAEWLTERRAALRRARTARSRCSCPQRGDRRRLVELALKNAASSFATRRNARADTEIALGKLQKRLKLHTAPARHRVLRRLAHPGLRDRRVDGRLRRRQAREERATAPTRFARPARGRRRRRRNDDFASMYEVLSRRFRRAREDGAGTPKHLDAPGSDRHRRRQGPARHGARRGARRRHRRAPGRGAADRRPGQGARQPRGRRHRAGGSRTPAGATDGRGRRDPARRPPPEAAAPAPERRPPRRPRRGARRSDQGRDRSPTASSSRTRRTPSSSARTAPRCSSCSTCATRRTASP